MPLNLKNLLSTILPQEESVQGQAKSGDPPHLRPVSAPSAAHAVMAAAREDSGGVPSSPESTFGVQMETPFRCLFWLNLSYLVLAPRWQTGLLQEPASASSCTSYNAFHPLCLDIQRIKSVLTCNDLVMLHLQCRTLQAVKSLLRKGCTMESLPCVVAEHNCSTSALGVHA